MCAAKRLKPQLTSNCTFPRARPRYLLQPRDSSHCLLRNNKEQHFLLFYQWASGSRVRSHATAQASGQNVPIISGTVWFNTIETSFHALHCFGAIEKSSTVLQRGLQTKNATFPPSTLYHQEPNKNCRLNITSTNFTQFLSWQKISTATNRLMIIPNKAYIHIKVSRQSGKEYRLFLSRKSCQIILYLQQPKPHFIQYCIWHSVIEFHWCRHCRDTGYCFSTQFKAILPAADSQLTIRMVVEVVHVGWKQG